MTSVSGLPASSLRVTGYRPPSVDEAYLETRNVFGPIEKIYDVSKLLDAMKQATDRDVDPYMFTQLTELSKCVEVYRRLTSQGVKVESIHMDVPVIRRLTEGDKPYLVVTDVDILAKGRRGKHTHTVYAEVPPRNRGLGAKSFRRCSGTKEDYKWKYLEGSHLPYPDEWWMIQHKNQPKSPALEQQLLPMRSALGQQGTKLRIIQSALKSNGVIEWPGSTLPIESDDFLDLVDYLEDNRGLTGNPFHSIGTPVYSSDPIKAEMIPFTIK